MSKFTPDPGVLFYAHCTRVNSVVSRSGVFGETTTVERIQDRSYAEAIFRAVAFDDRVVVAVKVMDYGVAPRDAHPTTLRRSDYEFLPVGPTVAEALGLVEGNDVAGDE